MHGNDVKIVLTFSKIKCFGNSQTTVYRTLVWFLLDISFVLSYTVDATESPKKSPAPGQSSASSSKHMGVKRERDQQISAETVMDAVGSVSPSQPPSKKQKREYSPSTITEEEVKHYLSRRPITSKDLVRKFTSKKTEMEKTKIVSVLLQIIQNLKNVEKQTIKGKMYLSLKPPPS